MKYLSLFFALSAAALLSSCDGMYDTLEEFYGELVYPAKYDTIVGHIGYERVEIDLVKAGRIPSSQVIWGVSAYGYDWPVVK